MILRFIFGFILGTVYLFSNGILIADQVIVKKSARMLYLLQNGEVFNKYHVTLGKVPVGDKEVEGDMKTPEGAYRLDYRQFSNACSELGIQEPELQQIQGKQYIYLGSTSGESITIAKAVSMFA